MGFCFQILAVAVLIYEMLNYRITNKYEGRYVRRLFWNRPCTIVTLLRHVSTLGKWRAKENEDRANPAGVWLICWFTQLHDAPGCGCLSVCLSVHQRWDSLHSPENAGRGCVPSICSPQDQGLNRNRHFAEETILNSSGDDGGGGTQALKFEYCHTIPFYCVNDSRELFQFCRQFAAKKTYFRRDEL